jgi:nitroreductase
VIVACATTSNHIMPCGHPSHLVNVAIAIDHMALAARALGLGTCWVGAFDPDAVREILGIPTSVQVIELLPLGYPTSWPSTTSRKPLSAVVSYDGWQ